MTKTNIIITVIILVAIFVSTLLFKDKLFPQQQLPGEGIRLKQ